MVIVVNDVQVTGKCIDLTDLTTELTLKSCFGQFASRPNMVGSPATSVGFFALAWRRQECSLERAGRWTNRRVVKVCLGLLSSFAQHYASMLLHTHTVTTFVFVMTMLHNICIHGSERVNGGGDKLKTIVCSSKSTWMMLVNCCISRYCMVSIL